MKYLLLTIIILITNAPLQLAGQQYGNPNLDKLLNQLKTAKEDTIKVKILDDIAWEYLYMNSEEGMSYAQKSLALATKLKWGRGIAISNASLGAQYDLKTDYIQSAEYHLASYKAHEAIGNLRGMAVASLNMGHEWSRMSDYPKALQYILNSLKYFEKLGEKKGMIQACNNLYIVYTYQIDYTNALKYLEKVKKIALEMGNKTELAGYYNNIGLLSSRLKDYDKALVYQTKSLELNKEMNNKKGIAGNLHNLGNNCLDKDELVRSLEFFEQARVLNRELNNINWSARNLSCIGKLYYLATKGETEGAKKLLITAFNGNKIMALNQAKLYTDSAVVLQEQTGDLESLSANYKQLSDILSLQGDKDNALNSYIKYTDLRDSIFNIEKDKKLTQTTMQYDFDKKEALAKSEQLKKDAVQRNIRNSILAGLLGTLIFLVVVYRQRNKIAKERKRSEELLHNILPEEVAEELKSKGSAAAKQFDEVTVLFTDFKDFTQIAESMTATELVQELNVYFEAFDNIITRLNIEKIKTIGDSYMCVGGLPSASLSHAEDVVNAGLEIQKFTAEYSTKRMALGKQPIYIRIGINTGPVVAGIVGVKKFAYDIWGDTVNTASRMESSGEPGKINISGTTYELIKDKFDCTHRGKIQTKGKGELDMYFVNGKRYE